MQGLWGSLSTCWDSVAAQLPHLGEQLHSLQQDLSRRLHAVGLGGGGGEVLALGPRHLRVLRKLGEGGYAFVYEVREEPSPDRPLVSQDRLALKKVLVGTAEQLEEARHEIEVMRQLRHPGLLPLLDAATVQLHSPGGGSAQQAVLMLFPCFEGGNLWDAVQAAAAAGAPMPLREVLSIFAQVCAALEAMHNKALAHRDVKPHNVLLRSVTPPGSSISALQGAGGASGSWEAVLTDFGSTRPAHVVVHNRAEAVALQEDAERHCSAPYRAPELWDVPSSCTIDERIDVWSLGCVLYYMLYASSPFELTANQGGGSLMLSVLNGRVSWPDDARQQGLGNRPLPPPRCPPAVRELVRECLQTDPSARPFVGEVKRRALQLLSEL